MQAIDWSEYQAFLAVARTGQLARAARLEGVDATTMGRRLRRLEARLGTTLFEQTRQGQSLTEAGEALLAHVETMAQAADAIAATRDEHGGLAGTLRVSVSEGFGSWFLARHLPDFAHEHPNLSIDLVASNGFLSPSRREADLAVMLSRPSAGPVVARKLSDYRLRLYASADYLAANGTPQSRADLTQGHCLIGYIPDLIYTPELHYLDEIEPGLNAHIRSSSIHAQYQLVASGAGIGVLPCFIGDGENGLVPLLDDVHITRSFWLVSHKDTQNLKRIRLFKQWLDKIVRGSHGVLMGVL